MERKEKVPKHTQMKVPGKKTRPRMDIVFMAVLSFAASMLSLRASNEARESNRAIKLEAYFAVSHCSRVDFECRI